MKIAFISLLLLLVHASTATLYCDEIVLPKAAADKEGVGGVLYPFSHQDDRALQRFSSTGFLLPVNTFMRIDSVAFRLESSFPSGERNATISELVVDVSTTRAGISGSFDATHGSNRMNVFDGPFQISSPSSPGNDIPAPFNIIILFSSPFDYDPRAGDLVIDVHHKGTHNGQQIRLDFHGENELSNYALYFQPIQNSIHRGGLVTKISYSLVPVPEPSPMLIGFFGVFAMMLQFRKISK